MKADELVKDRSRPPISIGMMDEAGTDGSDRPFDCHLDFPFESSAGLLQAASSCGLTAAIRRRFPPCPNSATRPTDLSTFNTAAPKPSSKKDDQSPRRGAGPAVDNPTDADTDRNSGDELARELKRSADACHPCRLRIVLPVATFRPSRSKRCFKAKPAALQVFVAATGRSWLSGAGFRGLVWPIFPGHPNLPARPADQPLSASKSRAT